jgi:hypothetical protein
MWEVRWCGISLPDSIERANKEPDQMDWRLLSDDSPLPVYPESHHSSSDRRDAIPQAMEDSFYLPRSDLAEARSGDPKIEQNTLFPTGARFGGSDSKQTPMVTTFLAWDCRDHCDYVLGISRLIFDL